MNECFCCSLSEEDRRWLKLVLRMVQNAKHGLRLEIVAHEDRTPQIAQVTRRVYLQQTDRKSLY